MDDKRARLLSILIDFFKRRNNGESVFYEYALHTDLISGSSFDIKSMKYDDSYIGELYKLDGEREYNIFSMFLLKLSSDNPHQYPDYYTKNRGLFHAIFSEFYNLNYGKLSLGDFLILYLDCLIADNSKRMFFAKEIIKKSNQVKSDNIFCEWFKEGDTRNKIISAYDYSQKNMDIKLFGKDIVDIYVFFDQILFIKDEYYLRYHLSKIKSFFNNRKSRATNKREQVNLQLSRKANNELDRFSNQMGLTRSKTIELMLMTLKESGAEKYIIDMNQNKNLLRKFMDEQAAHQAEEVSKSLMGGIDNEIHLYEGGLAERAAQDTASDSSTPAARNSESEVLISRNKR